MAGAGKSEACRYLAAKGFPVLRFGDETDRGLRLQGLSLKEENERKYRENLRQELGMAAYAIKIEPRINEALKNQQSIILDGLYSWEEYVYLQPKFPGLKLIVIYARPQIRYRRLAVRAVRQLTPRQARARDIAEIEVSHKAGPIAIADYLVDNNGSLDQLHYQLDHLLANKNNV
ncbi:dephospho-CoA kinase [Candidatus Beckwithbacteria bacterium CG23_combo_of_CG06-09_8_20_14_all_47_9]|uniref:Dephospho-CoA kinase n=1 Tax=Candidatus Beckwithbacteria bacterium CG23_combo_of_CG06-09_8_20_14_all_47_9 TaxID=1974498 RepID=A0A2H0B5T3_9BACT|nr:MAG: dephospho-CoA kinase [Candidatus Beckwithbacteria bacterium CG23_combo_of_CG06-09_8_20_14_all_47_9]